MPGPDKNGKEGTSKEAPFDYLGGGRNERPIQKSKNKWEVPKDTFIRQKLLERNNTTLTEQEKLKKLYSGPDDLPDTPIGASPFGGRNSSPGDYNKFLTEDQKAQGFSPSHTAESLEDMRAKNEGWTRFLAKGAGKFLGGTAIKVAQGFEFVAAGLIDLNTYYYYDVLGSFLTGELGTKGLPKASLNLRYNNKVGKWLERQQKNLNEALYAWESSDYKNADNLWQKMGEGAFAANEVNDAVQFLASMFVPGGALKAIGTAGKLGRTGRLMSFLGQTTYNTIGESGMEAKGVKESVERILQGKTNPETGKVYTKEEIEQKALAAGNRTFAANFGPLMITNAIPLRAMFPKTPYIGALASNKRLRQGVASGKISSEGLKGFRKGLAYGQRTGKAALGMFSEVAEETLQTAVQLHEEDLAKGTIDNFSLQGYVSNFFQGIAATGKGLQGYTLSDREMQQAIAGTLGGLIGAPTSLYSAYIADPAQRKKQIKGIEKEWAKLSTQLDAADKLFFDSKDKSIYKEFEVEEDVIGEDGKPTGEKVTKTVNFDPKTGKQVLDKEKAMKYAYNLAWEKAAFDRILASNLDGSQAMAHVNRELAVSQLAYNYFHMYEAQGWGSNIGKIMESRFEKETEESGQELTPEQQKQMLELKGEIQEYVELWKKVDDKFSSKDELQGGPIDREFHSKVKKAMFMEMSKRKALEKIRQDAVDSGNDKLAESAAKMLEDSKNYENKILTERDKIRDDYKNFRKDAVSLMENVNSIEKAIEKEEDPVAKEALQKQLREAQYLLSEKAAIDPVPMSNTRLYNTNAAVNPKQDNSTAILAGKDMSMTDEFHYNMGMSYQLEAALGNTSITVKENMEKMNEMDFTKPLTDEDQALVDDTLNQIEEALAAATSLSEHVTEENAPLIDEVFKLAREFGNKLEKMSTDMTNQINSLVQEKEELRNALSGPAMDEINEVKRKHMNALEDFTSDGQIKMDLGLDLDLNNVTNADVAAFFDEVDNLSQDPDDAEVIREVAEDVGLNFEQFRKDLLAANFDVIAQGQQQINDLNSRIKAAEGILANVKKHKSAPSRLLSKYGGTVNKMTTQGRERSRIKAKELARKGELRKHLQQKFAERPIELQQIEEQSYLADRDAYDNEAKLLGILYDLETVFDIYYKNRRWDFSGNLKLSEEAIEALEEWVEATKRTNSDPNISQKEKDKRKAVEEDLLKKFLKLADPELAKEIEELESKYTSTNSIEAEREAELEKNAGDIVEKIEDYEAYYEPEDHTSYIQVVTYKDGSRKAFSSTKEGEGKNPVATDSSPTSLPKGEAITDFFGESWGELTKVKERTAEEAKLTEVQDKINKKYDDKLNTVDNEITKEEYEKQSQDLTEKAQNLITSLTDQDAEAFLHVIVDAIDKTKELISISRENRFNKRAKQAKIERKAAQDKASSIGITVNDDGTFEVTDQALYDLFEDVLGKKRLNDILSDAKSVEDFEILTEIVKIITKKAGTARQKLDIAQHYKQKQKEIIAKFKAESKNFPVNIMNTDINGYVNSPERSLGRLLGRYSAPYGEVFGTENKTKNPFYIYNESHNTDSMIYAIETEQLLKDKFTTPEEIEQMINTPVRVLELHKQFVNLSRAAKEFDSTIDFAQSHISENMALTKASATQGDVKIVPNKEQIISYRKIAKFLNLPILNDSEKEMSKGITLLKGPAGSGKTKLVLNWAMKALGIVGKNARKKIYAFSHKARTSAQIANSTGGSVGSLEDFIGPTKDLSGFDVIVIDEAPFMSNKETEAYLAAFYRENKRRLAAKQKPLRMILLGDPGQITKEVGGNILVDSDKAQSMNILDPLTQVYRSEVPSIVTLQGLFRGKVNVVSGITAVANMVLGTKSDKNSLSLGVHAGSSTVQLVDSVLANADTGRSKVIIVNDQEAKETYTNHPKLEPLVSAGKVSVEVMSYDEAQGQTFEEVYVHLDPKGSDLFGNKFSENPTMLDFNKAMYTALSRAESYIFVLDPTMNNQTDPTLSTDTEKGKQMSALNFEDLKNKFERESELMAAHLEDYAQKTNEAIKETIKETKEDPDNSTGGVSVGSKETAEEYQEEDPDMPTDEDIVEEDDHRGEEENTEQEEIDDTTNETLGGMDEVPPFDDGVISVDKDGNQFHDLGFPENDPNNFSNLESNASVVYARTKLPDGRIELAVLGQRVDDSGKPINRWTLLGIVSVDELGNEGQFGVNLTEQWEASQKSGSLVELNLDGTLTNSDNSMYQDENGKLRPHIVGENGNSGFLAEGNLEMANPLTYVWNERAENKGFIQKILDAFRSRFMKDSKATLDYEIKVFSKKELEDKRFASRTHKLHAGVPYLIMYDPRKKGVRSYVTDQAVRLTPNALSKDFPGVESMQLVIQAARTLRDELNGITLGHPLVNEMIKKFARAKGPGGTRMFDVDADGRVTFGDGDLYTYEDYEFDALNREEIVKASEGMTKLTREEFEAIKKAAKQIVPQVYGSRKVKRQYTLTQAEKMEMEKKIKSGELEAVKLIEVGKGQKEDSDGRKKYYLQTATSDVSGLKGGRFEMSQELRANGGPASKMLNQVAAANTRMSLSTKIKVKDARQGKTISIQGARKLLASTASSADYRQALMQKVLGLYLSVRGQKEYEVKKKTAHTWTDKSLEAAFTKLLKEQNSGMSDAVIKQALTEMKDAYQGKPIQLEELEQYFGENAFDSEGKSLLEDDYLQTPVSKNRLSTLNENLNSTHPDKRKEAQEEIEGMMGSKFETVEGTRVIVRLKNQDLSSKPKISRKELTDDDIDAIVSQLVNKLLTADYLRATYTTEVLLKVTEKFTQIKLQQLKDEQLLREEEEKNSLNEIKNADQVQELTKLALELSDELAADLTSSEADRDTVTEIVSKLSENLYNTQDELDEVHNILWNLKNKENKEEDGLELNDLDIDLNPKVGETLEQTSDTFEFEGETFRKETKEDGSTILVSIDPVTGEEEYLTREDSEDIKKLMRDKEDGNEFDSETFGKFYTEDGRMDKGRNLTHRQAKKLARKIFKSLKLGKKSWIESLTFGLLGRAVENEPEIRFVSQAVLDAYSGQPGAQKGLYIDGAILILSEEGMVSENVLRHEFFHKVYSEFLTPQERKKLRIAAKRISPKTAKMNLHDFEEWVADRFGEHRTGQRTFTGRLKRFFNNIWRMATFAKDNRNELERLFDAIDNGHFSNRHPELGRYKSMSYLDLKKDFENASQLKQAIKVAQDLFNQFTIYNPNNKETRSLEVLTYDEIFMKIQEEIPHRIEVLESKVRQENRKAKRKKGADLEVAMEKINYYESRIKVLETLKKVEALSRITDYLFPNANIRKQEMVIGNDDSNKTEVQVLDIDSTLLSDEDLQFMETLDGVNLKDVIEDQEKKNSEDKLSVAVKFALSNIRDKDSGQWLNPRYVFAKMLQLMENISFQDVDGSDFASRFAEVVKVSAGLSSSSDIKGAGSLQWIFSRIMGLHGKAKNPSFNVVTKSKKTGQIVTGNTQSVGNRVMFVNSDALMVIKDENLADSVKGELAKMTLTELTYFQSNNPNAVEILSIKEFRKAIIKNAIDKAKQKAKEEGRKFSKKDLPKFHVYTDQVIKTMAARVLKSTAESPFQDYGSDHYNYINMVNRLRASYQSYQAKNTLREMATIFTSLRSKNMYVAEQDLFSGEVKYFPIGTLGQQISIRETIFNSLEGKFANLSNEGSVEKGFKEYLRSTEWSNLKKKLQSKDNTTLKVGVTEFLKSLGLESYGLDLHNSGMQRIADDLVHLFEEHLQDVGKLVPPKFTKAEQESMTPEELAEASTELRELTLREELMKEGSTFNRMSKQISQGSQFLRPSSVRDSSGNTVYLHHNSSQGDDLIGTISRATQKTIASGTGLLSRVRVPGFFKTKFFQNNPFINGQNQIQSIIDHDGIKVNQTGKSISYTNEGRNDWFSRNINMGMAAMINRTSSKKPQYAQWFYTISNRPRIKGAIVNFNGKEGIMNGIESFIDQMIARPDVSMFVKNYNKYKDTNFEIFSAAIKKMNLTAEEAILKVKNDLPLKKQLASLMYDKLTELSRKEAENLVKNKFKFSKNFNKAFKTLATSEDSLIDTSIKGEKVNPNLPLDGGNEVTLASKNKDYPHTVDQVHYAIDMMFKNNYINSYFLNQAVAGDFAFFKNSLDLIKRMSGVFAPGQKGLVNELFGMQPTFKMAIVGDAVETIESVENFLIETVLEKDPTTLSKEERDAAKEELKDLLSRFGQDYELTDAQGFILPERREELERGFGESFKVGRVNKGAHYETVMKSFKDRVLGEAGLKYSQVTYFMNEQEKLEMIESSSEEVADFDAYLKTVGPFKRPLAKGESMDSLMAGKNGHYMRNQIINKFENFKKENPGKQIVTSNKYAFTKNGESFTAIVGAESAKDFYERYGNTAENKLAYRQFQGLLRFAQSNNIPSIKTSTADGVKQMVSGKKVNLKENESVRLDSDGRPVVYAEAAVPVMIKYSTVELSDDLVKKYPALNLLRKKMRKGKIGEMVFGSGNKIGQPKDKFTAKDLIDPNKMEFPENSVYDLSNENFRLQSNPDHITFHSKKGVANPTQLGYFLSVMNDMFPETTAADDVYNHVTKIIEKGMKKFKKEFTNENGSFSPSKFATFVEKQMRGQGNERYLELLQQGISYNAPHIVNKALSQFASKLTKATVGIRLPGEKLTLQSSFGIRNQVGKFDSRNLTDEVLKKGEELKYKIINDRMVAETILPVGILPKELEKEIMEKVKKGEEVYLTSDLMGFRIPSTELHSAVALKVVDFYDQRGTSAVIVPKEVVPLHGSDFDVDSLFVLMRSSATKRQSELLNKLFDPEYVEAVKADPENGIEAVEGNTQGMFKSGQPISYVRNEDGQYVLDKEFESKLEDVLVDALAGKLDLTESELKMLDEMQDKLYMNNIVEPFMEAITHPKYRTRMLSPISMEKFNGRGSGKDPISKWKEGSIFRMLAEKQKERYAEQNPKATEEELMEAAELQNEPDLSTWEGNYEVFKSNMDGRSLTGVFANSVKSLAYMARAGKNKEDAIKSIDELIVTFENSKTDLAKKVDPAFANGVVDFNLIDSANLAIEELKKVKEDMIEQPLAPHGKYPPMLTQNGKDLKGLNLIGKKLVQMTETSFNLEGARSNVRIWDILDSLINASIDNVKEQILPVINANGATANAITAMLSLGTPIETVVMLMRQSSVESIPTQGNKIMDSQKILNQIAKAYLQKQAEAEGKKFSEWTDEQVSQQVRELKLSLKNVDLSQEELNQGFVQGQIDMLDLENGNLESALSKVTMNPADALLIQAKVMTEFIKAAQIGEDIADMSSALNIIRSHPSEFFEYEKLGDKWESITEVNEEGDTVINENYSFDVPGFFTANPHILASYRVFQEARDLISQAFTKHRQEVTDLVKEIYSDVKVGLAKDKFSDQFKVKEDFMHFLFTSINNMSDIPMDMTFRNSKGHVVRHGAAAWSNHFAKDIDELKALFLKAGISNAFLESIAVRETPFKREPYIQFTAGNNLQYEDILLLQEGFQTLSNYYVKDGKLKEIQVKSSEYSQLQEDFVKYAVINFGIQFSSSNYSLVLPADLIKEYINPFVEKLEKLIESGNLYDYKDIFMHQLALNRGKDLPTVRQVPTKTKGISDSTYSAGFDPKAQLYYSLKFKKTEGKSYPRFMTYGSRGDVYMRVEPTERTEYAYYVKLGKSQDKVNYMVKDRMVKEYSPIQAFTGTIPHIKLDDFTVQEITELKLSESQPVPEGGIIATSALDDSNRMNIRYFKVKEVTGKEVKEFTPAPDVTYELTDIIYEVEEVSKVEIEHLLPVKEEKIELETHTPTVNTSFENSKVNHAGKVQSSGIQTAKVSNILESMEAVGSPYGKKVASFLRENFPEVLEEIEVVYYHEKSKDRLGYWDPKTPNKIYVALSYKGKPISQDDIESTFIHELVHAFTVKNFRQPQTVEQRRAADRIRALYKQFKKQSKKDGSKFYGLTNELEFIAEAMSNPKFQEYLDSFKVSNRHKNFLSWFMDALRQLFGVSVKEDSALAKAFDASVKLMEAPTSEEIEGLEQLDNALNSGKKLDNTTKNIITVANDIEVDMNPDGTENDFYKSKATSKIYNRVSDQTKGLMSKFLRLKAGKDYITAKADRIWKGVSEDVEIPIAAEGKTMNKQEYIEYVKKNQKMGQLKGKAIHKIIEIMTHNEHSKKTKEELTKEKNYFLDQLGVPNKLHAYSWVQEVVPHIFEQLNITALQDEIDPEFRDRLFSEVTVANDELGFAGTADMMVKHADGAYSLLDWKSGKSFETEVEDMLMLYGNQMNHIFDNPRHKAHLQLVFYAVMLKANNPEMKFRDLAAVWMPNKYEALGYNPNTRINNVKDYLNMIETYLKESEGETYKKLLKQSPDLFKAREYSSHDNYQMQQEMIDQNKSPEQYIEWKQEELKLLIQSKVDNREFTPEDVKKIKKYTKELVNLANDSGYAIKDWSEDISEMSKWLGTRTDVNHPLIRIYRQTVEEALDKAQAENIKTMREFENKLKPVMEEYFGTGIPARIKKALSRYGIGALNPIQFNKYSDMFKFAYKTEEIDGATVQRLLTEKDKKEWAALSEAKRELLTYVNDVFGSYFEGKDAFLNRQAVTMYGPEGQDLTDIELFNADKRAVDKFEYKRGFLPMVPPTDADLKERFAKGPWGVLNRNYLRSLKRKYLTFHHEMEFERWGDKAEGIPIRYLGTRAQRAGGYHSQNLVNIFDKFTRAMHHKKYGDNAMSLARGMQVVAGYEKEGMESSRVAEFLDKHIDMELLHRSQMPFSLTKKPLLGARTDDKARKVNIFKVVESLNYMTSASIMWLKPFAGLRNFVSATIMTKKDAFVNSVIGGKTIKLDKRLGIDPNALDFSLRNLSHGMVDAGKTLVDDVIKNDIKNNKLFLLMEEFRFSTTAFELSSDARHLKAMKESLMGGDLMYIFHSAPEEYLAASILSAQLRNMKLDIPGYEGKSMWDLYEVEKVPGGTGKLVYKGPTRGQITKNGKKVKVEGITSDESAKMREVYKRIHGGYRRGEKTALDWHIWGKMIGQFKKFLPNLLKTSFESKSESNTLGFYKIKEENGKPVTATDENGKEIPILEWHQRVIEGRWRTVGNVIKHYLAINTLINNIPYLTPKGKNVATSRSYAWSNLSSDQKRTVIEAGIMIILMAGAYATLGIKYDDTPEDDSWKKFWTHAIDTAAQQWNVLSLSKDVSKYPESASASRTYKTIKATADLSMAAFIAWGMTPWETDEAYTTKDELKGWTQFKRGIPFLSSYYDFFRFTDNITEKEDFEYYRPN
jgi:hypothetical protein